MKNLGPNNNPQRPTQINDAPEAGEGVKSAFIRGLAQAVLDGFAWVNNNFLTRGESINADTLDGLDSSQFARAGSVSNNGGNAATLQGHPAADFLGVHAKADNAGYADNAGHANNADTVGGYGPAQLLSSSAVATRLTFVRFFYDGNNNVYVFDRAHGQHADANWRLEHVVNGTFGEFQLKHNLGAVQFQVFNGSNSNSLDTNFSANGYIYMIFRIAGIKSGQVMSDTNSPDATLQYIRPATVSFLLFDVLS